MEVDGTRLHCARAGLVLPVHLVSDGWLHQGSLVCPACEEICAVSTHVSEGGGRAGLCHAGYVTRHGTWGNHCVEDTAPIDCKTAKEWYIVMSLA